jgi:hypothetical protein
MKPYPFLSLAISLALSTPAIPCARKTSRAQGRQKQQF